MMSLPLTGHGSDSLLLLDTTSLSGLDERRTEVRTVTISPVNCQFLPPESALELLIMLTLAVDAHCRHYNGVRTYIILSSVTGQSPKYHRAHLALPVDADALGPVQGAPCRPQTTFVPGSGTWRKSAKPPPGPSDCCRLVISSLDFWKSNHSLPVMRLSPTRAGRPGSLLYSIRIALSVLSRRTQCKSVLFAACPICIGSIAYCC
ncbi:hypothetical protein V1527DRAFT_457337 [Lipomyces starkeyi]